MKHTWSAADQRELDALNKRKEAFERERRKPLEDVILTMGLCVAPPLGAPPPNPQRPGQITADRLIAYAQILRDALRPFDAREREAEADHD